jgi:thiol:disulfide interchange protein DsbD
MAGIARNGITEDQPMHETLKRLLIAALLASTVASAQDEDILRPEQAYRYAVADTGDTIEIDWVVEDGYYLYRNRMSYASSSDAVVFGAVELPEGERHEDEFFGVQQVYRNRFFVSIPYTVVGDAPDSFDLIIRSQGCADIGLCYPPQTWTEPVRLTARTSGKIDLGSTFGNFAGADTGFLPVDEAFEPVLTAIDGNAVEVAFRVADGYYLYKDKIAVRALSDSAQAGRLDLPAGEMKTDQYFGEMEVYHGDVFGNLAIARATPEPMDLELELKYQGCAEDGICYPPVTRVLSVSLPQASAVSALSAVDAASPAAPLSEQARLAQVIAGSSLWVMVATFFGAGLLLAFTPCVLPMVPILSGIIAGEGRDVSASRGFSLALSYVMGMAVVYTAAGVAAAAAGLQLQATFNQPWILTLFSTLFVVLAAGMFGLYDLQVPSALQSRLAGLSSSQKGGTAIGAFVMGAISSLIVTACVAPALIAALTVMAQTGDMLRGGTALFAMSLGMGAPLLAVGAAQGKLLPKAGPWMVAVRNAFGFMMLGLAIWMMSRVLPGGVTLALWGILIFMAGVYMGGLTSLAADADGMRKFGKGAGLLAVIYGAVLLVGSLSGSVSLLRPLEGLNAGGGTMVAEHRGLDFRRIKTTADLDAALASAAASGKTAMLDFYADWCVSCIEMEEFTFTDSAVQEALANTMLLQADVTANDEADQALLERFGVFGPPTIIFFDRNGAQRQGYEVVGFMKARDFANHVRMATGSAATLSANN